MDFEIMLYSSLRLSAVLLSVALVPKYRVWTENIKWKILKINNSQKFSIACYSECMMKSGDFVWNVHTAAVPIC